MDNSMAKFINKDELLSFIMNKEKTVFVLGEKNTQLKHELYRLQMSWIKVETRLCDDFEGHDMTRVEICVSEGIGT
jgi:hypothetical protein